MKINSLLVFLLTSLLAACILAPNSATNPVYTQEVSNLGECPEIIPTPELKPVFLKWVFPYGVISKAEYDELIELRGSTSGNTGGIEATIEKVRANPDSGLVLEITVRIIVDKKAISEPLRIEYGLMEHGPYYYHWVVNLDPGYHEAKIEAYLDNGKKVEYLWNFCITP